jgi:hypothetical protein
MEYQGDSRRSLMSWCDWRAPEECSLLVARQNVSCLRAMEVILLRQSWRILQQGELVVAPAWEAGTPRKYQSNAWRIEFFSGLFHSQAHGS